MPIIPSTWTGLDTVNAIGLSSGGGGGSTSYAYASSLTTTLTELDTFIDLVGVCNESISREISLDLITGKIKLYWKNLNGDYTQIQKDDLVFNTGYNFIDFTLGQLGLSVKCSEITSLFLVLRWDKDINFTIYDPSPIVVPDLITVVDNVVYIDENLGSAWADTTVICTAYFPDDVGEVIGEWQWIGMEIGSGQPFSLATYSGAPSYVWSYTYPTQFNPYVFEIDPSYSVRSGKFLLYKDGYYDYITQQVNILSYDKTTNTFILGLV